MPKIRGTKKRSAMLGHGKKDSYDSLFDAGGTGSSCYGSCGRDNPCESGCMCMGGSSGGDWEGTCDGGLDNSGHQLYSQGGGMGDGQLYGCPPGSYLCPGGGACLPGCKKYHDPNGEQCLGGNCSAGHMKHVAQNFIDMYMPGYDGSVMSVMDCVAGGLWDTGCQDTCCGGPHTCCMSIA